MDCRGFDPVRRAFGVWRALGVLVVTWGLVACAPGLPLPARPQTADEGPGAPTASVEPPQETAVMTPTPQTPQKDKVTPAAPTQPAPVDPRAERVVQLARQDLAKKLGLPLEAIRVVSVEAVEWSDASLGCPQPGMMYAQVITPGFRVVLAAKDQTVEYHTDMDRRVVSCAK